MSVNRLIDTRLAIVITAFLFGHGQVLASNANPIATNHAGAASAVHLAKRSQKVGNDSSAKKIKLVDINKATKAELMKLQGIGEIEANKIVAGRPYNSKADITTKGHVPAGIYLLLKNQIVVK